MRTNIIDVHFALVSLFSVQGPTFGIRQSLSNNMSYSSVQSIRPPARLAFVVESFRPLGRAGSSRFICFASEPLPYGPSFEPLRGIVQRLPSSLFGAKTEYECRWRDEIMSFA